MKKEQLSFVAGGNTKWYDHCGRALRVSHKIPFLYNPVITHLDIYSNELKICVHTKACMEIYMEALVTIVKTWKPPRCPSVSEWINKLSSIQIIEY